MLEAERNRLVDPQPKRNKSQLFLHCFAIQCGAILFGVLGSFLYREIRPLRNNLLCMKRQDGKLKLGSRSCGGEVIGL